MAKRICPFCKEKVKANAAICKHCRSDLPALPPKKWYQTWKGFFLIMFILGIIVQAIEEKPDTTDSTPKGAPVQSSSSSNKALNVNIDEKKALQDSYFGNFKNAKIIKKSGSIKLEVWQPWIQHVRQSFPSQVQNSLLIGPEKLTVTFDEIWKTENDENLTGSEKRQYKGQLDILTLYWKGDKVQASTVEKYYTGNPLTGSNLSTPAHKITDISDRQYILKNIQ